MMENKNNTILIVVVMAIVAIGLAGLVSFNAGQRHGEGYSKSAMKHDGRGMECSDRNKGERDEMKVDSMDHSGMTMDEMIKGLEGLTGDEFDKAFVEMMIVHHQGALDMAKQIPVNVKHPELKKLGEDIVTAQTKEIEMMRSWLKKWGYEKESGEMMMKNDMEIEGVDHSMMGM
jgi:hypothetical protein